MSRPRPWPLLAFATLAILASSCAKLPPLKTPQAPARWTAQFPQAPGEPQGWLNDFQAPRLHALVARALAFNYDLQTAVARLEAARAQARIANAPRLPALEANFDAARNKRRIIGSAATASRIVTNFDLGATVNWELDLWGRLANAARAAAADAKATQADYRAARLLLAADVSRGWFGAIEAELQVRLADRTAENFRRSLAVIEERYRRGLNTALDVRLARENVASAESTLAVRRRERDAALRALEVLLGRYPAAELVAADSLPKVQAPVPAGLPAALLTRRPDLVAAEYRLTAAGERLKEARKNRLPALRLTASGGTASGELQTLLDGRSSVWSLLAGLTQPLFQGGRLAAEQALTQAERHEAWASYAQAVLTAFREVETALAAEAWYREQEAALRRAAEEAGEAAALALDRYRQGLVDIITLLESQRRAFDAESARLRTARERLNNRVTLYLALGGDFGNPAGVTP
ncbi:MAG: efflux transporter outer membrane subunit [Chromatiaceae bacterium]|nr:efflux transporter outer membrane subunit [Chromatiaceae bacterium]